MTVFAKADEVSELLNCGKSTAYKIMRQLNNELKEKGYMTISGNVNRAYLFSQPHKLPLSYPVFTLFFHITANLC